MYKKLLLTTIFAGAVALSGLAAPVAYAAGPTGTVTYNGAPIVVTDGHFFISGIAGTVDETGYYSWNGYTGNIQNSSSVVTKGTISLAYAAGYSAIVTYNGTDITVTNGQFTYQGKPGTLDLHGFIVYGGLSMYMMETREISKYQIPGQPPVVLTHPKAEPDCMGRLELEYASRGGAMTQPRIDYSSCYKPTVSRVTTAPWSSPPLTSATEKCMQQMDRDFVTVPYWAGETLDYLKCFDPKLTAPVTTPPTATTTPPNTTPPTGDVDPLGNGACADLQVNLRYSNKDSATSSDVSVLQDFLNGKGYLASSPTGFFGRQTLLAVKSFQSANNIIPTGFVGAITRAKIKSIDCI